MLSFIELKNWFEDLWSITVDANLSINNWRRLLIDKYEYDSDSRSFGFFEHHTYQLRFIATIQLNKLLSDSSSDKRSLVHLLGKLKELDYDQDFKDLLEQNAVKHDELFKTKADIQKVVEFYEGKIANSSTTIKKIVIARHNLYAHKAPNPKVPLILFEELEELLELVNEIYQKLCFGIFFSSPQITKTQAWGIDPILFHMTESYKADRSKLEENIKAND